MAYVPRSVTYEPILAFEYKFREVKRRVCTFDTETDPFAEDVVVAPFTCGFYDGEVYVDFWGDDCIDQFSHYLCQRALENPDEELLILCHNWGGFDINFCYRYLDKGHQPLIVGRRIASCKAFGHEFRDSYKIIASPLRAYQKDEFDYSKNLRDRRETFKDEIRLYQRHDCEYLYELVSEYYKMFGDKVTIGSTAIAQLQSFHGFQRLNQRSDEKIRPYFFGGRTQCFEIGVLEDDWQIRDVRSMYPDRMCHVKHPISNIIQTSTRISENTAFAHIVATNRGALPVRGTLGELSFLQEKGEFFATIHEINMGLELGLIEIHKVITALDFIEWTTFDKFVMHFFNLRMQAIAAGDKLRSLYYKLLLNNAYGKFAQNPANYEDYYFNDGSIPEAGLYMEGINEDGWQPRYQCNGHVIWARRARYGNSGYFNVATGASITGAARAKLLYGLSRATRPVYCDTDSIVCRSLDVPSDTKSLGDWETEAEGKVMAIAGKKMYALFDADGRTIKQASKGVGLTAAQIKSVALGETITYKSPVPSFHLDGTVDFLTRTIQATG